jgi:hypothetical protein
MVRMLVFDLLEKVRVTLLGPLFQRIGKKLIHQGFKIQGKEHYADRCNQNSLYPI